jgi:hypothetical protein
MEYWNGGIMVKIITEEFWPLKIEPTFHYSNIPSFRCLRRFLWRPM